MASFNLYKLSNQMMCSGLVFGGISVLFAYQIECSIGVQIVAHLGTMLCPILVKLGYIARLTALRGLDDAFLTHA